ncbi:GPI ethanolamine phosphate transferase 2 [Bidens hawaiensis]|uniref:GPI ethanolamine phosphate transferase 2 n=1 Tax=Bidens hawaiensis TaxID=980011 RepID=UPI0040497425
MKCSKLTVVTAAAVAVELTGLSLFVFGFFPIKPALSGLSGPESYHPPSSEEDVQFQLQNHHLKSLYHKLSQIPPSYDRLILMLYVSGVQAEFVLGNTPPLKDAMPYTQSLLASKMALAYHAKAAPPTVTLPRLKAITTGSIAGFLDVLFNFNTQALLEDNIIGQFFRIGWKMVMLGDETWLKLFPGLFTRHDGVSSFFVKDTVQVDHNVSRHLSYELYKDDWNLLILHYLGLDHVGHLGGHTSVMMGPKLQEMDDIIKQIHLSIIHSQESDHRRTLLVVVSDHGMQENGNHGGSSYEETDSLALFIGPGISNVSATYDTINQVDITPTLALLFGIPSPKNSAGYLIADLFNPLQDHQLLRAMELNSWQLLRLLQAQATYGSLDSLYLDAAALHGSWKSENVSRPASTDDLKSTVLAYNEFLRTASYQLSSRATDKPIGLLSLGIMAMLLSCVMFLGLLFKLGQDIYPNHKFQLSEALVGCVIVIIVLSMGSSSLVEEEQYLWHFLTSTFFLILLIKSTTGHQLFLNVVILISGRILKGWHQGGVNWTHLPDISKSLEISGSAYIKLLQIISILLVTSLCLYILSSLWSRGSIVILVGLSYLCTGLLVLQYIIMYQGSEAGNDAVQLIYGFIITSVTVTVIASPWFMFLQSKDLVLVIKDSLYLSGTTYMFGWCLLQHLLQQPVNSMVISLLLVQVIATIYYASHGGSNVKQWVEIAAIYYLGMAGHFSLGNTNTLATIDVAGAFIGISSHSTVLSGVIMFVITYASPMLALLSMVMSVSVKETHSFLKIDEKNTGQLVKMILGFPCLVPLGLNSVLLVAYTIILLVMRNHLFIWSVFSPKYIYVVVMSVCVIVGVLIVASTVTYIISASVSQRKKKPAA